MTYPCLITLVGNVESRVEACALYLKYQHSYPVFDLNHYGRLWLCEHMDLSFERMTSDRPSDQNWRNSFDPNIAEGKVTLVQAAKWFTLLGYQISPVFWVNYLIKELSESKAGSKNEGCFIAYGFENREEIRQLKLSGLLSRVVYIQSENKSGKRLPIEKTLSQKNSLIDDLIMDSSDPLIISRSLDNLVQRWLYEEKEVEPAAAGKVIPLFSR